MSAPKGKIRLTPELGAITVGQYYRLTWQALIALAAGLAVSSGVVRPYVLLPFFIVAYVRITPMSGVMRDNRRRLLWGVGVALALLLVDQVLRFKKLEDLVEMMIEIVSGTVPLLVIDHEKPRRYWLAVLNVTIVAIGSITFASSVPVYLAFLAYVVALMLNLNAATLYRARAGSGGVVDDVSEPLPRGYFRQNAYVLPAGVISAILIFLAFPRVQNFNLSFGKFLGHNKIGYSGGVELNGSGEMVETGQLAFRVDSGDRQWLAANAARMHFRGDALDTFDGVRWKGNIFNFKSVSQVESMLVAATHADVAHSLTIYREPMPTAAIFYPDLLVSVVDKSSGSGKFLFNTNGAVSHDGFVLEAFSYSLKVVAPPPPDQWPITAVGDIPAKIVTRPRGDVLAYEMTDKDLALYTNVPKAIAAAPWYQAWVAEVAVSKTDSLAAAGRRLSAHFESKFQATLKNEFSGQNALQAFLTTERRGHCEYFATAAALLLRTLGVPTRVVVGYYGGHYNDLINLIEVSEDDAHAWVEAYLPGYGWATLDPTPGDPLNTRQQGFQFQRYANAVSFWFREYFVDYNHETQRGLMQSIRKIGVKDTEAGASFKEQALAAVKPALLLLAALVGIGLTIWAVRLRRRTDDLPRYYRLFSRRLASQGLKRRVDETFREFHGRIVEAGIDPALVRAFDLAIERDLFGRERLPAVEADVLIRAAASVPRRLTRRVR